MKLYIKGMIDCKIHELAVWLESRISKDKKRSPKQKAKVTYAIEITIAELSKLAILVILFTVTGNAVKFIILFSLLLFTRSFLGGFHAKTYLGCLCMSLLFFGAGIWAVPYMRISRIISGIAFVVYIIFVIIIAPVQSPNRPKRTVKWRLVQKLAATVFSAVSYIIITIAAPEYILALLYVFYFQLTGALVVLIRRRFVR